jgi:hypothetical protein
MCRNNLVEILVCFGQLANITEVLNSADLRENVLKNWLKWVLDRCNLFWCRKLSGNRL